VGSRWPQALVQDRKQLRERSFVLAAWPSCRGPRQPAVNELAVVPSTTPGSLSSNAWPARPRCALSRHILGLISLRALFSVPSGAAARADHLSPRPRGTSGAVFLLETGAKSPLGYKARKRYPHHDVKVAPVRVN
jgi:hypothetical protein